MSPGDHRGDCSSHLSDTGWWLSLGSGYESDRSGQKQRWLALDPSIGFHLHTGELWLGGRCRAGQHISQGPLYLNEVLGLVLTKETDRSDSVSSRLKWLKAGATSLLPFSCLLRGSRSPKG